MLARPAVAGQFPAFAESNTNGSKNKYEPADEVEADLKNAEAKVLDKMAEEVPLLGFAADETMGTTRAVAFGGTDAVVLGAAVFIEADELVRVAAVANEAVDALMAV